MIQSLGVKGLNGQFDYIFSKEEEFKWDFLNLFKEKSKSDVKIFPGFYQDFNIFTGYVGSGKTTLLKLIWYLTSGNLQRIVPEIPLENVKIMTTDFELSMTIIEEQVELDWKFSDKSSKSMTWISNSNNVDGTVDTLRELNEDIAKVGPGSLFFPTFRRNEGGYSAEPKTESLKNELSEFSKALSGERHKFIVSFSTLDVVKLLSEKDAQLKELQAQIDPDVSTAQEKETLETRFSALEQIVYDIYEKYSKIEIPKKFYFSCAGESENGPIIRIEKLSSGEKQLLSFLSYNAFADNATFFIDEPELSLHVDLQRMVLAILQVQGTPKQFFVATHTPYIYARYSGSEFNLTHILGED